MKVFLGLVIIILTLVIAGRQSSNKISGVLCIFLCGFMIFSVIAELPDNEEENKYTYHSTHSYSSFSQENPPAKNVKPALTKEQADKLRGTGYHNTKPNSQAECIELKVAQVKCIECGYHSDNGGNSLCDYCQWKQNN